MKSAVESLEGNKVKVSVEVDETEFDKAMDAAFRRIAREVRIPGFRPGKADGFGLVAMRQRVTRLAGSLEVETTPGGGTGISATVPAIPAPEGRG